MRPMANDSFRTVTNRSWISRLANSVAGVGLGLIAVLALPMLLFWNEGRAVQTARSLAEGAGLVVAISADRVEPGNEGKLVHLSGPLAIAADLVDDLTGMRANAVSLTRTVEMYQWVEKCTSESRTKLGGGEETVTTCTYSREWREGHVSSSSFRQPSGHQNPDPSLQSQRFDTETAGLGAFTADRALLSKLGDDAPLAVERSVLEAAKSKLPGAKPAELIEGRIMLSRNPLDPSVSDLRIGYRSVPGGEISAVAQQVGTGLAAYQTAAGDTLLLVARGRQAASAIFAKAAADNEVLTWILRAVGLGGLFIGFLLLLGPIGVLADVLPPVGALIRLGTGVAASILALALGGVVIGVAWLFYRPLLALAILAATSASVWVVWQWGRRRKEAAIAAHAKAT